MKTQAPSFDFGRFLADRFQSPKRLISFLAAYGVAAPSEAAVEKWFQRGAIPGSWFPTLLTYLEIDDGKPVRLLPYLTRPR